MGVRSEMLFSKSAALAPPPSTQLKPPPGPEGLKAGGAPAALQADFTLKPISYSLTIASGGNAGGGTPRAEPSLGLQVRKDEELKLAKNLKLGVSTVAQAFDRTLVDAACVKTSVESHIGSMVSSISFSIKLYFCRPMEPSNRSQIEVHIYPSTKCCRVGAKRGALQIVC